MFDAEEGTNLGHGIMLVRQVERKPHRQVDAHQDPLPRHAVVVEVVRAKPQTTPPRRRKNATASSGKGRNWFTAALRPKFRPGVMK
eukprot:5337366-Prymnesium_polylepis.1